MHSPDTQPVDPTLVQPERRCHRRYTVQIQIEIHREGSDAPLHLETTDLSRGGCYIHLPVPLSVGIRVHGTIWLDDEPALFRGLIVTRHPEFGNGIMFLDFEGQGDQLLQQYLTAIIN